MNELYYAILALLCFVTVHAWLNKDNVHMVLTDNKCHKRP